MCLRLCEVHNTLLVFLSPVFGTKTLQTGISEFENLSV